MLQKTEAILALFLMRFLGLRLKPKAAAAPRAGKGPETEEGAAGVA
jgi:hypothetical protein